MKKTKRMFAIAAFTCGICALTACADNPNDMGYQATTNAADDRRINDVTDGTGDESIIRDIGDSIEDGVDNIEDGVDNIDDGVDNLATDMRVPNNGTR